MLAEFAALPLALCTNKPRRTTLAVLAGLGLSNTFRAVSAGGDHREKKPHPRPILALGETSRCPRARS